MLAAVSATLLVAGCGEKEQNKIHIAYQYGIGYAPVAIAKEQKLLEKLLPDTEITWQLMNSGSTINAAVTAGEIDFAMMGTAPFLIGVDKQVPYKLFTGMSTFMPIGLISADPDIKSLKDFTDKDRIAVVSYGSIQHILLCMGAEKELGEAHALDKNIISMTNPEGFATLKAGKSEVKAQLSSVHYYLQLEEQGFKDIMPVADVFMAEPTLLLGAVSDKTLKAHPEYLSAMLKALQQARDFISSNPDEAAAVLAKIEGTTPDKMKEYMSYPSLKFMEQTQGIIALGKFMQRAGFINKAPDSLKDIATDNLSQSN